jgi:glycolate oxidase FAD binding subunit
MMIAPESLDELVEAVRATPHLLAIGAGTKPRLSAVAAAKLSMTRLSGIVEYDPGEFTFTALAGTTVREIAEVLAKQGQYLPFDPLLSAAGATLGGTVAAGLSGPGRFRFGGVRDFILGVRFVDGAGRLLRMGGKVVKNAAGFDLPKFFVGSLGRFGVLAEMTFKVFPRAASTRTLKLALDPSEDAASMLTDAANSRWEPDALDLPPDARSVLLRLAGPETALEPIFREILGRWPGRVLSDDEAQELWTDVCEFRWAHADGALFKVVLTPGELPPFQRAMSAFEGARVHVSAGGNVAFVSLPPACAIDEELRTLGLRGVMLRGDGPLWLGVRARRDIDRAVKEALDPQQRFPSLDDD